MGTFLLALAVFLLLHVVPAMPGVRPRLVAVAGRRAYLIVYSLVSLAVLAWLFHAALAMDYVPLWEPAPWQAWFPLILTPLGLFFLVAGLASANPLSITMRRIDAAPGAIVAITRHPVLWGFLLWSASHLVPNGDLRSLLLFGALSAFALFGIVMGDRRARRRLGSGWRQLAASTSVVPFAAIAAGRARLRLDAPMAFALAVAVALTVWLLLGGHAALFGADPLALAGG